MDMGAGDQASRDRGILLDGRRSWYADTEA